jgi:hypothetical protein
LEPAFDLGFQPLLEIVLGVVFEGPQQAQKLIADS